MKEQSQKKPIRPQKKYRIKPLKIVLAGDKLKKRGIMKITAKDNKMMKNNKIKKKRQLNKRIKRNQKKKKKDKLSPTKPLALLKRVQ